MSELASGSGRGQYSVVLYAWLSKNKRGGLGPSICLLGPRGGERV